MSKFQISLLSVAACGLAGCATIPNLPDEKHVPVRVIVDVVQCELKTGYKRLVEKKETAWFKSWVAKFTLDLKVEQISGLGPELDFLAPMRAGSLGLNISAGLAYDNVRAATLKFTVILKDLEQLSCPKHPVDVSDHPFVGSLGLDGWMERALGAIDKDDKVNAHRPDEFGYALQFQVMPNGRISTPFSAANRVGNTLSGRGDMAMSRSDTQALAVTFLDGSEPPAQKVEVVNWPKPKNNRANVGGNAGSKSRSSVSSEIQRRLDSGNAIQLFRLSPGLAR